jgi:hypothetical protein
MIVWDKIGKKFEELQDRVDVMNKALTAADEDKDTVGRKAFLTDPMLEVSSSQGSFRQKFSRLSNRLLKESSIRDTIISAILRHRRTQIEMFCNVPQTRYDTGFTFVRRDGQDLDGDDFKELKELNEWMYFCGEPSKVPVDDRSTMATQFGMITQDILTFGHMAVEKVRDRLGNLQRVRHVPAESIYHVNKNRPKAELDKLVAQLTRYPGAQVGKVAPDDNAPRYIQVVDSKEVAVFSDHTMVFKLFQPPSFMDNNGYSMSLVESCILSITRHLQAENYNSLFFTHGFAARGLIHLKGSVSQQNLQAFRNQFNAVINGNNNSWRTPIIAGLDDIKWIPLAGSQRDMEYIQYTDHLIRTMCAQAQIDPVEIGFDYLSRGTQQSSINSPNNEWKITASQERGLIPLIRFFEDFVNHDLLPELSPTMAQKYMFKFVGLDVETKQQEIARLQAEMTVHSSLNDIMRQVRKSTLPADLAADVPLNTAWLTLLKSLRTVGEMREELLGDEGASQRPELQYIPDPLFIQWQQVLSTRQQAAAQQEQSQLQAKMSGTPTT